MCSYVYVCIHIYRYLHAYSLIHAAMQLKYLDYFMRLYQMMHDTRKQIEK